MKASTMTVLLGTLLVISSSVLAGDVDVSGKWEIVYKKAMFNSSIKQTMKSGEIRVWRTSKEFCTGMLGEPGFFYNTPSLKNSSMCISFDLTEEDFNMHYMTPYSISYK